MRIDRNRRLKFLFRFAFCLAFAWSLWSNIEHSRERRNASRRVNSSKSQAQENQISPAGDRQLLGSTDRSVSEFRQPERSVPLSGSKRSGLVFGRGRKLPGAHVDPRTQGRLHDPYPAEIDLQKQRDNYLQTEKDVAHQFSRERQEEIEQDRQQLDNWK